MAREVSCPRCRHVLTVADDGGAGPLVCPQCGAPLENSAPQHAAEEAGGAGPEAAAPTRRRRGKLQGKALHSSLPVVFGFLLPVLTASCIVAVVLSHEGGGHKGFDGALGFLCLFTVLDILVVVQIGYWVLRQRSAGDEALQTAGKVGLFVLASLAAVIFLFATCLALSSG